MSMPTLYVFCFCLMVNLQHLICEITLQQVSFHLLLYFQVISRWQGRAKKHKSHMLSCGRDLNLKCSLWSWMVFNYTSTFTYTDIRAQTGFHTGLPEAILLALKPQNICEVLWLIILVLHRNHAIRAWAMAEHEPYGGKEETMRPLKFLMKPWGPWLHPNPECNFLCYLFHS